MHHRYKHGMTKTNFYHTWVGMKGRCENKKNPAFFKYGERGISVCDKWKDFNNFFLDMNESYEDHIKTYGKSQTSLDRINNNQGYSKENCRWATPTQQARNTRQNNLFEFNNIKATLAEWSEILGIKRSTLAQRIYVYKWNLERALS